MKVNYRELSNDALNWAVAKCEGLPVYVLSDRSPGWRAALDVLIRAKFATDWSQAGPIIEREKITISIWENKAPELWGVEGDLVYAAAHAPDVRKDDNAVWANGSTMLIAAMRCYVGNKLGTEIDIPDDIRIY